MLPGKSIISDHSPETYPEILVICCVILNTEIQMPHQTATKDTPTTTLAIVTGGMNYLTIFCYGLPLAASYLAQRGCVSS